MQTAYFPVYEFTRGNLVESIHFGAIAVADAAGRLYAWYGNPNVTTYWRSTAKPFQALPFIENGGAQHYGLTTRHIALMCASHSGTHEHARTAAEIQQITGTSEFLLQCGVHPPYHEPTAREMEKNGQQPTPNYHNCSGKHSGMLAFARMLGAPLETYLEMSHPVQQAILNAFAEMCGLSIAEIGIGTDGCSAPNFATPLQNAAAAYARLCDPQSLPPQRATACQTIVQSMIQHPDMVGGPERFDTTLMQIGAGKLVVKAGAEGFQGVGLLPGALGPGSPALGIAAKIADGDGKIRARPPVILEVLRQLGALNADQLQALNHFGPILPVYNWRKIVVGQARPCFNLQFA